MSVQVSDEMRRHLSHVISILEPYALATGPIDGQNSRSLSALRTST
jgi:hypothetical protein